MASELRRGPKIHPKRSLCEEFKYAFKARINELYFQAIETNGDPEKVSNFELECGLFFLINSICFGVD